MECRDSRKMVYEEFIYQKRDIKNRNKLFLRLNFALISTDTFIVELFFLSLPSSVSSPFFF